MWYNTTFGGGGGGGGGGVYEDAAASQVSVICGMNPHLCVTVHEYGEVVLIKMLPR